MLLGICGAAGCGKDTLAYELVNHDAYEQYRMADPIKAMLQQFHIFPDTWDDHEAKERNIPWLGKSPRYLAQTLGTEWGRELINEDIWVLLAKGRWHHLNAGGKGRMIVSDVRFKNEAEWIRSEGGIIISLVRDSGHEMDNRGHKSEDGLPPHLIDALVYNDGTVKEMYDRFWEAVHVQVQ